MMRIFTDIQQVLSALVPEWALPFVLGGLVLALLPPWLESVRGKQIKGAIRRMVRAEDADRDALAERALGLAGSRRGRLIGLVQEALRYGQHPLTQEGLRRLAAHPRGAEDARKLRARVEKPVPPFRDPVEAVVRIEALLDQGLVVAAAEQLERASAQFPEDPELSALAQRASGAAARTG